MAFRGKLSILALLKVLENVARDWLGSWHSYIDLKESMNILAITKRKCKLVFMRECATF